MMRGSTTRLCVLTAALLLAAVSGSSAQNAPRTEYEIKAAYLFTFGRFVEWPPRPAGDESPFTICVLGVDPFGPALDATIADGTLRGKKAVGKRIAEASEAAACHIVFISASEERRLDAIIRELGHAQVLTVSDMPGFVDRGGMIQFVSAGNRIRFEISLLPARDAGLTMSSELLKVASAVRNNRPRG